MEIILRDGREYVLRLDPGEEVLQALKDFCAKEQIPSCFFVGIGGAGEANVAYYDLKEQKYRSTNLKGILEVASLIGDVTQLDGKYAVHLHGTFGRDDLNVVGGHVQKLVISATCELHLKAFEKEISRGLDERTGLNVMQPQNT